MNDFKEYSAAFHDHQNELMHYGVPGMTWDPSKKKKNGQKTEQRKKKNGQKIEEQKKKEDRLAKERTVSDIASSAGKGQLGVQLAKAVYDAIPKKHNEITGSLKNTKLSGKKIAPKGEPTKEELLAGKKKRRGKYKRGTYAERRKG